MSKPLNLFQRLVLLLFVSSYSESYEHVLRHNKTLVRKNARLTNSNAQLRRNR